MFVLQILDYGMAIYFHHHNFSAEFNLQMQQNSD